MRDGHQTMLSGRPAAEMRLCAQETAPVTPDVENARAERDAKQPGAASGSIASDGSEQQLQTSAAQASSEITPAPMQEGGENAQPSVEA